MHRQKSPVFSHDLESGNLQVNPSELVRKKPFIYRLYHHHLSLDSVLISLSRPLPMPDRKSSLEKRRGDKSSAPCDAEMVEGKLSRGRNQ